MTTVKEDLDTCNLQPTLRPTVNHHRDNVFKDVKPSIAELLLSNDELWQQEDLSTTSSVPSISTANLSTRSNVNAGANVENVLYESSPFPVLRLENRAIKITCDLSCKQISPGKQVSSDDKCLEKNPNGEIQPSETEEMGLDQSPVDYFVSENVNNLVTNDVDIKPLCSKTLFSGGIINKYSLLDSIDSTMKNFKLLHQEQKQNNGMLSGTMSTDVDMSAMHCSKTSENDCMEIKTEYSDELVPRQSDREVGHLDIETEYSDELIPEQSERVVGHLDIKTELSDELVSEQSERVVLVGHLDIKTELPDELVPGQSEKEVVHFDTVSYGDKSCGKIEDSILTDCGPDDAFTIEPKGSFTCSVCLKNYTSLDVKRHIVEQHTKPILTMAHIGTQDSNTQTQVRLFCPKNCNYVTAKPSALPQHLSACEEPELGDKVYCGDSDAKDLDISSQQCRTLSRQTEYREDDDAQTMSAKGPRRSGRLQDFSAHLFDDSITRCSQDAWCEQSGSIIRSSNLVSRSTRTMDEGGIFQWLMLFWLYKRRRARHRYWMHRINQRRNVYGEYHHLIDEILTDEERCIRYIRMKPSTFHFLLEKIGPYITKRTTNFRKPLPPKERLVITLRYLCSGETHVSISCHFRAGVSTIRSITTETCKVLWDVLQKEVMPIPDREQWLKTAAGFNAGLNFPNCLGAIDGKHIRLKKPNRSGSKFYNYKGFFSIVLLAVTDANGKFIIIDASSCGSNSDDGVFSRSDFGKRLLAGKLDLPQETFVPETDITLPFVFIADDAFPLRENVMKPFPHRQLTLDKEIFNYRLSRTRNSVECSFGKIAQMWRILLRQMDEQPDAATNIIKAITVLHNFILMQEPERSVVQNSEDDVAEPKVSTYERLQPSRSRASKSGLQVRDKFMTYFLSPQGALPWQNSKCYNT